MTSKNPLKILPLVLTLASGALAGCATVAATNHVKVLEAPPAVPYETLGNVDNFQEDEAGFSGGVSSGDLIAGLREKAGELGADAVIITSNKHIYPAAEHLSQWGTHPGKLVEGIAIRYKKAGAP